MLVYDLPMDWAHYLFEHLDRDSADYLTPALSRSSSLDVMAEQRHDLGTQADGHLPWISYWKP